MDIMELLTKKMSWLPPKWIASLEKHLKHIPYIQEQIQKEYDQIFQGAETALRPYKDEFPTFFQIPEVGRSKEMIIADIESLHDREISRWKDGYVSGAVYHGDQEHIDFLNQLVFVPILF